MFSWVCSKTTLCSRIAALYFSSCSGGSNSGPNCPTHSINSLIILLDRRGLSAKASAEVLRERDLAFALAFAFGTGASTVATGGGADSALATGSVGFARALLRACPAPCYVLEEAAFAFALALGLLLWTVFLTVGVGFAAAVTAGAVFSGGLDLALRAFLGFLGGESTRASELAARRITRFLPLDTLVEGFLLPSFPAFFLFFLFDFPFLTVPSFFLPFPLLDFLFDLKFNWSFLETKPGAWSSDIASCRSNPMIRRIKNHTL